MKILVNAEIFIPGLTACSWIFQRQVETPTPRAACLTPQLPRALPYNLSNSYPYRPGSLEPILSQRENHDTCDMCSNLGKGGRAS